MTGIKIGYAQVRFRPKRQSDPGIGRGEVCGARVRRRDSRRWWGGMGSGAEGVGFSLPAPAPLGWVVMPAWMGCVAATVCLCWDWRCVLHTAGDGGGPLGHRGV